MDTPSPSLFSERQTRNLKRAVIAMGVAIVLGIGLLIYALYARTAKRAVAGGAAPVAAGLAPWLAAADAEVASVAVDGGRVIVHLRGPGGSELAIFDSATGSFVARVALTRIAPAAPR